MEDHFDAIVIGSGIGGLSTAVLMGKIARKRVLVLERHFKPGGFTHSFSRPGGWEWDVGLHYVGGMAQGSTSRALFDFVTGGRVQWNPMPDEYDHFHYPGLRFSAPKGARNYEARLIERFPEEAAAIRRYFRDVKSATGWVTRQFWAISSPAPLSSVVRLLNRLTSGLPLQTTKEYLERRFRDPQLRALLASQWGDYGLAPAKSAFCIHSLIAAHYFDGAYYPEGGAGRIAEGASQEIRQAGGEVLVNDEVQRILMENGRAVGVEVRRNVGKGGETVRFHAPVIVSDAGAANTFKRMLPPEVDVPFRAKLDDLIRAGNTAATIYIGFKRDPSELGFRGENHWIFDSFDHDAMLAQSDDLLNGVAHVCYLSFPSLKDPRARRHTAEIIAPLSYESVARFRDQPWRRRAEEYQAIKEKIGQGLIALVEKHYPGFCDLIEFQEVSTPLSVEHFTAHPGGGIYGIAATPERFRQPWLQPRTHIPGLYLTGADAGTLGIMGALMGGVAAASLLIGPAGFMKIVAAAKREAHQAPVAAASPAFKGA
ncbi:MAG TPA: NAD(P)/FAD-dependent oxidoreductase [Bryobacteraceae bacterium]|nr:NAD(P)/FAD-dependent oxidoreductase [Bryobacteraceae bacterium]